MGIEAKLDSLPVAPGVYLMKGAKGEVLYVGKAKSLRSRVRSYFRDSGDGRPAVKFLAAKAADLDWIITANEKEALFLEDTLLKKYKPRYNIRLKDSKTYCSIKITAYEKFPRILVTREIKRDGGLYFGPYVSTRAVRDTVKFLRRIFPLCVCGESVFRNRVRPCLDYQLGLCAAPAVGLITEDGYRELVKGAVLFLQGKDNELLKLLKDRMRSASARLDFEEAARLRDRIGAIKEMLEEQKAVTHKPVDRDVFAVAKEDGAIVIQALFVRDGRLVGGGSYFFEEAGLPDDEAVSSFLARFYMGNRYVPDEVIVPIRIEDAAFLSEWLSEKKGRKACIFAPERGEKLKLLRMAEENARESLKKKGESSASRAAVISELKDRLRLANLPNTIEAFDISNIGGAMAVGAMTVFKNGEPHKDSYRRYRIGVEGPDDYAMMREVLHRRYRGGQEAGAPDLILVDGGKGQLNIACRVLRELGIKGVDIAALAKDKPVEGKAGRFLKTKGERVFRPNVKDPIALKENSRPDLLIRRIRDTVHSFAVTYHRRLRSKGISSVIDGIPGIGAKTKKALFERFGDIPGMQEASVEELGSVPGVGKETARLIKGLKG